MCVLVFIRRQMTFIGHVIRKDELEKWDQLDMQEEHVIEENKEKHF